LVTSSFVQVTFVPLVIVVLFGVNTLPFIRIESDPETVPPAEVFDDPVPVLLPVFVEPPIFMVALPFTPTVAVVACSPDASVTVNDPPDV
jgi:hypothetical protein